jgi:hypothetical protein
MFGPAWADPTCLLLTKAANSLGGINDDLFLKNTTPETLGNTI